MDIQGKNLLVIGGAGLIGSHTVDKLLTEDVDSITIYDNFARGREENLIEAFKDPRVSVYEVGGGHLADRYSRRRNEGPQNRRCVSPCRTLAIAVP